MHSLSRMAMAGLFGLALGACDTKSNDGENSELQHFQIGQTKLSVEKSLIQLISRDSNTITGSFDTSSKGAFLLLPTHMFSSLATFEKASDVESAITLNIASASSVELPETRSSSEVLAVLTSPLETPSTPKWATQSPIEVRMFRRNALEYVVAITSDGNKHFLAACVEMRGQNGAGPDMCYRQFRSGGLQVRIGMSERLVVHADAIERDVECFLTIWGQLPSEGKVGNRYSSCYSK